MYEDESECLDCIYVSYCCTQQYVSLYKNKWQAWDLTKAA
jgi:hypothetical protein